MQMIDTTIVNVALPHMQGSLGASSDEITWTLTSYLVSSAIFMPLTGYFSDILGRKKYLLISIIGFTVASALCGASMSLTEMVVFRMLQGIFGAALVPLSQAIMTDIFSPEDRGKAMAIWGMGVMVGPILGPTLGGYLTDIASWRWTFYVNIPIGILTLLLIHSVPESRIIKRSLDWIGLGFMTFAIGGLQFVLDRGNTDDWFNSLSICIMTYLTIASFLGFILHYLKPQKNAVFDLRIFKDRNFTIASLMLCIFGLGLYGMMVIQPMMMEGLMNYPVLTTGLILAPRGIAGMVSMMFISKIIRRVDPRLLIAIGIVICIIGMRMGTYYSLNIDTFWLLFPLILQGFGLGMVFVPLSTIAFSTLPIEVRTEAAGLYSLLRTVGASMGVSVAITVYTRSSQYFWHLWGGFINPYNPALYTYLKSMHLSPHSPTAIQLLSNELMRQADMVSFINVFAFIIYCFMGMIPLTMLIRKSAQS
jgi:DHA2 family multidrug resistance protein